MLKLKINASVYCFFLKPSINSFGPQQKKSQIISLVLIMNIKNQDSVGLKSPVCLFVSVCPSVCLCVILCVCMSFYVSVWFWVFLSCVCPEEQESGSGCSLECRSQQPAAQNWPEMGISLSGIQFRGDAQFIFLQIFIKNYILEYFTGRNFVKLGLLFIILVHDRPTSVKSRLLELYLVPHLLPRLPGHICPILEPPYVQLAIVMFAFFWVINSQSVPSTMSQQHQYNFERHMRLWNKSYRVSNTDSWWFGNVTIVTFNNDEIGIMALKVPLISPIGAKDHWEWKSQFGGAFDASSPIETQGPSEHKVTVQL